ncbi:MAG: tRNA (adenosine(37)-N6)-threonylcarbamoyltransferase complex transferase subunit TsaD [Patescibacteria group bacterium]
MRILAIETSCDETAFAYVEASGSLENPQFTILQNIVSSQIEIHRPFGGVVPNLAKREHLKNLPIIYEEILQKLNSHAKATVNELRHPSTVKKSNPSTHQPINPSPFDLIAVTVGPGLEPALWTGIEFAKKLSVEQNIPVVGANHMEGHLYSFLLQSQKEAVKSQISNLNNVFPAVVLVVSGGHTILLKMDSFTSWEKLGETRDDAAGEVFDKVARMLKLPYPGGPEIQKLAEKGNATAIQFPRPMLQDKNYEFSFSGLKTSVLYYLRDRGFTHTGELGEGDDKKSIPHTLAADVAASFQKAVIDVLVGKTMRAAKEYDAKSIILCGGVAANKPLRERLVEEALREKKTFFAPEFEFNTDNAAMIAAAAYMGVLRKNTYPLEADASLSL